MADRESLMGQLDESLGRFKKNGAAGRQAREKQALDRAR